MPTSDGGDDLVRISRPGEGLGTGTGLCDVAVDGGLEINHRVEYPLLEALALSSVRL